jgi:hypothetical protein
MALDRVGAGNIDSLTENSTEANKCNLWYDFSRLETLEMYDWSFARKRLTLSEHTDAPPDGVWAFRYQYPVDCVRARYLENPFQSILNPPFPTVTTYNTDAVPYEVGVDENGITKSIMTNMDDAVLVYTFDQQDVNMFSLIFVGALSFILASNIAYTLSGKEKLAEGLRRQGEIKVVTAAANSYNESVPQAPRDADWIRGR